MEETSTSNIVKIKIKEPPMYRVIMLNDDVTTFNFVIFILEDIFLKSPKEAHTLCMQIHLKGSATVGIYTLDIAKSKIDAVEMRKRRTGFPLQLKIQAENV